jgi:hypothetical protein
LFVPIPGKSYDDGGTREYNALTYKIVDWNKISGGGVYEKTKIYFGKDKNASIDALWEKEVPITASSVFFAKITEIKGNTVTVSLIGYLKLKQPSKPLGGYFFISRMIVKIVINASKRNTVSTAITPFPFSRWKC